MNKHLRNIILFLIVIAYSVFQTTSYYNTRKAERTLINSKLEYNLKNLESHPINTSISQYDEKYGTTLSLYSKAQTGGEHAQALVGSTNITNQSLTTCFENKNCTQQELISITKELITANNEEPFWGLNAIMKCFIYPLLVMVVGAWIIKVLKI